MNDALRDQLWETFYINPVYPAELLANLQDPDYTDGSYVRVNNGCVVDLTFYDEGQLMTARYHFDEQDQLQKAFMYEGNRESVIYDRQAVANEIVARLILSNRREYLSTQTA